MSKSSLQDDLALLVTEARAQNLSVSNPVGTWTEMEIVNLTRALDLGIERTLILLLKARWEVFLVSHPNADLRQSLNSIELKGDFDPDPGGMLRLLETQGLRSPISGDSRESLTNFVREAVLNQMHQVPIRSPECEQFVFNAREDAKVFNSADAKTKERLADARGRWISRCAYHADLLLALANQQLANARINHQFMQEEYGDLYIELQSLDRSEFLLLTKISLKQTDLTMTCDELDQKMLKSEEEVRKELDKMRDLALVLPPPLTPDGEVISAEQVEEYKEKAKTVLRRVWMLLHPDRLERREGFRFTSARQRERLKELWNEIMKVRPEELAFEPQQLGYNQRSLERILQMEREAKTILESMPGINLQAKYKVQGENAEERIKWYETECRLIEEDLEKTRALLTAEIEDPEVAKQRAMLDVSGPHREKALKQMRDKIDDLRSRVETLHDQLDHLFEKGAP